ncbi:hypothetical protein [Actinospica robiniae]|uniref:hypothetical protein n=1 Tax=Actinospica robiniae TaxID=304901 RepID=UPI0012FB1B63|nr:hypothetical protein [Actinospica robiniae]
MIITPTWWQPSIVISWGVLAGGCVEAAVSEPHGVYSFGALLLLWLLAWAAGRSIRLEVTEAEVIVTRGYVRMQSNVPRRVARSRLGAIHYYPKVITFCGPDGTLLMRTKAEWSLKQMITVAAELQVPIYDNRRFLHLVPRRTGRLAYDPVYGRRPR